jgi:two-component sensor histidine kinase
MSFLRGAGPGADTEDAIAAASSLAEQERKAEHDALEQQVEERNSALQENEFWLAAQKEAFQAALNGEPLEASLGLLVRAALKQTGGDARCAFYIADIAGAELRHVVGMPDEYAKCVEGFRIAPDSLACGLAVYTGAPIVTTDVTKEARWAQWLWLAERYHYRACWSFPIETVTGRAVGTFAMYFGAPRSATARDRAWAAMLTRTAAIIISQSRESEERARAVAALQASEADLRQALVEREALLKELHHRVKNNLQVIISLLEMQADKAEHPQALASLTQAINRVATIASMHELLHASDSVSEIDLVEYVRRLVADVVSIYRNDSRLKVSVIGEGIVVDLARAVPLGLLLNELLSNACKHAFPQSAAGELEIGLSEAEHEIHVRVRDSGVGLPVGLSPRSVTTLGLQLVHTLAQQLGGRVTFTSAEGTIVDVQVPRRPDDARPVTRAGSGHALRFT